MQAQTRMGEPNESLGCDRRATNVSGATTPRCAGVAPSSNSLRQRRHRGGGGDARPLESPHRLLRATTTAPRTPHGRVTKHPKVIEADNKSVDHFRGSPRLAPTMLGKVWDRRQSSLGGSLEKTQGRRRVRANDRRQMHRRAHCFRTPKLFRTIGIR